MRQSSQLIHDHIGELIVFYDENESQESIKFGLQKGENLIGKNPSKCSVVCDFSSEIDDVNTKISIEAETNEFTIEDQGSKRGTFKIKSDNSLIRLKPYQPYDLASPQEFYIGRYRKSGKYFRKEPMSIDDDIEENPRLHQYYYQPRRSNLPLNAQFEVQELDEDDEMEQIKPSSPVILAHRSFQPVSGQLGRRYKGIFKNNLASEEISSKIKFGGVGIDDDSFSAGIEENNDNQQESREKFIEWQEGVLLTGNEKVRKESIQQQKKDTNKFYQKTKRTSSQIIQEMVDEEDNLTLNSQFIKRIKERLKSQIDFGNKKKIFNAPIIDKKKILSQDIEMNSQLSEGNEKSEDEDCWKPSIELVKKLKVERKTKEKTDPNSLVLNGRFAVQNDDSGSDSIIQSKRNPIKKKKTEKIEKKQTDKLKKVRAAAENLELEENQVLTSMTKKINGVKKDVAVKAASAITSASKGISKTQSIGSAKTAKPKEAPLKNGRSTQSSNVKDGKNKATDAAKTSLKKAKELSNGKRKQEEKQVSKKDVSKNGKKAKPVVKKTKTAKKKEVLSLHDGQEAILKSQLEMPRRNQFRILFSNCAVTDEEKTMMTSLGARIVKDVVNQNDFNLLVTDEFKRRLKTLVALNLGYPIVSSAWVSACVDQEKILPVEKYLLQKVDAKFTKAFGFNITKSRQNNIELEEPLLSGLSFGYSGDSKALKTNEVRLLVESAGGIFREALKVDYWLQGADIPSDLPSHSSSAKRIDLEGLLQTCLLQDNVLDKFEFGRTSSSKSSKKK